MGQESITEPRLYSYVGPKKIADRVRTVPPGIRVAGTEDILQWVRQTNQELDRSGCVIATFIVDEFGWLYIANRRSEHVACAGGRPVQCAGEMTFLVSGNTVSVVSVTNQSTGYCPEPESWPGVSAALERAGIESPVGFSQAFVFRRCVRCRSINIVKDGVFECGVCSAGLPAEWNVAPE